MESITCNQKGVQRTNIVENDGNICTQCQLAETEPQYSSDDNRLKYLDASTDDSLYNAVSPKKSY